MGGDSKLKVSMSSLDYVLTELKKDGISNRNAVLDIGFHNLDELKKLALLVEADGKVIGIDINFERVQKVKRELTNKYAEKISVKKGSIVDIPFSDNYFDLVFCKAMLHEVQELDKAFKEMFRVLKPGGSIAIIDFIRFSRLEFKLYGLIVKLLGKPLIDVHPGFKFNELQKLLPKPQLVDELEWKKCPFQGHLGFSDKELFLLKIKMK